MEDMIPIEWSPETLEIGDAVGILVTPQGVMQLSLEAEQRWSQNWDFLMLGIFGSSLFDLGKGFKRSDKCRTRTTFTKAPD